MPPPASAAGRADEILGALAELPGVRERAEAAREACTRLRFDEALRRRIPEAAAESRVRGARASAALEGAEMPVNAVRDHVRGAVAWGTGPVDAVVRGAVQATAETEHVTPIVRSSPLQALARLHVAAAGHLLPADQVGRPRTGSEDSRELLDLGPAPIPSAVSERLAGLTELMSSTSSAPALVLAAVVHAEVATMRPFVRGNGIVARAVERAVILSSGLDPTGVAVPEFGHAAGGGAAYLGALAAYASGRRDGVALWLQHCGDALQAGAEEGMRICAAVRAGRLT